MRLPVAAFVAPALLAACASSIMQGPAPMANVPVQSWAENLPDQGAVQIYLRNDSKVDRLVTELQIFNCVNVRQDCKTYTPNVVIPAGKVVKAMRLSRVSLTQDWKYQYTFQTRSTAPTVTTSTTSGLRPGAIRPVELTDPESFVPRATGATGAGRCHPPIPGPNGTGMSTLSMDFTPTELENLRTIFLTLDAEGRPTRYSDNRGDLRVRGDLTGVDTTNARTTISLEIGQHLAILVNQGGNKPAEFFQISGPAVMTAASIGNPRAVIDWMLKECGAR